MEDGEQRAAAQVRAPRWQREVRLVVALGLAVAAWLVTVPAASLDGSSCGVPMFGLSEPEVVSEPRPADCVDRNQTRALQGITTVGLAGLVWGVSRLARWLSSPPSDDPRVAGGTGAPLGALRRQHDEAR